MCVKPVAEVKVLDRLEGKMRNNTILTYYKRTDKQRLRDHMEWCSQVVNKWTVWKRNMLGVSSKKKCEVLNENFR